MNRTIIIALSIAGVVLIIMVSLITYLFTSKSYNKDESDQSKRIIALQDSTIKRIQLERDALLISIAEINKTIQAGKASAEISLNKVAANKPFYQDNTKKYESIPVTVRGLSNDSLQSAIEGWYANH